MAARVGPGAGSAIVSSFKANADSVGVDAFMAARRLQSSNKPARARASDGSRRKLDEAFERRLKRFSTTLDDLQRALDAQSKRTAALQAQIDHLDARVRGT